MNEIIKSILNKLIDNGYEAYVVGGYVRDLLLGKNSFDIDICTNALERDLLELFPNINKNKFGGVFFKQNNYYIEITTYRKEYLYKNRKPTKIIYIDNLEEDLKRRDFTINTICLNIDNNYIDLLKGINDLKNKKIKLVGDKKQKVVEDPLRILRGVRFATTLDFTIESDTYKIFKDNQLLVKTLSEYRIREELDKILLSENVQKGIDILYDLGILNDLNIKYNNKLIYIDKIEAMYAQLEYDYPFLFSNNLQKRIKLLKRLLKCKIDNKMIYYYGLNLASLVGKIKGEDLIKIEQMAQKLPIKTYKDINIDLNKINKKFIRIIEEEILDGKLDNTEIKILDFINKWGEKIE